MNRRFRDVFAGFAYDQNVSHAIHNVSSLSADFADNTQYGWYIGFLNNI